MISPFVFGKAATGNAFINRQKEAEKIKINLVSGINTTLISPRRWGKTSLVRKAVKEIADENINIRYCFIDLFEVRNEEEFYEVWLREIIKASSSKWEEWIKTAKELLKGIIPSFSFGLDPQNDLNVKLELQQSRKNIDEILELPEKIADKKNIQFVVCIDEFQKVAQFADSLNFQQKLRAKWQHFQKTCFCLLGSKRHIITDLFENQAMPFYRFGDLIYLRKIEEQHWKKFIPDCYSKTGKKISVKIVKMLLETVDNHPYHIQQLAHQVWINTGKKVTPEIFLYSLDELLNYNAIMYIREIDDLSALQVSFLEAIVNGEKQLTSKKVINKYRLGTAGNIQRLKKAIENKEIVDFFEESPCFIDPLFKVWFRRTCLRQK